MKSRREEVEWEDPEWENWAYYHAAKSFALGGFRASAAVLLPRLPKEHGQDVVTLIETPHNREGREEG
jgi:hypothetical protein